MFWRAGKSSRMGRDKALLELAGKPLVRHAVKKLRRVCMDVQILSDNEELASYAPLVRDMHPGCGPMAGMEAALRTLAASSGICFMPVDMPFLPTAFISGWVRPLASSRRSEEMGCASAYVYGGGTAAAGVLPVAPGRRAVSDSGD